MRAWSIYFFGPQRQLARGVFKVLSQPKLPRGACYEGGGRSVPREVFFVFYSRLIVDSFYGETNKECRDEQDSIVVCLLVYVIRLAGWLKVSLSLARTRSRPPALWTAATHLWQNHVSFPSRETEA